MSQLDKLQQDVAALPADELLQFAKWLDGHRKRLAEAGDSASRAPKKRGLAAQALAEWKAGKGKLL